MTVHNLEAILLIQTAIVRRANRENLWDMPLKDVDLESFAGEIWEYLDIHGVS